MKQTTSLEVLSHAVAREQHATGPLAHTDFYPAASHEIDAKGSIVWVNEAECELLGMRPDQLLGRPIWELVSEEERAASRMAVLGKLAGTTPVRPLVRGYNASDGRKLLVEIHEKLIRNAADDITGIRSVLIDVTEREKLRAELAESERRYRAIVENAGLGIVFTTKDDVVSFANTATALLLDTSADEVLGRSISEFIPEDQHALIATHQRLRDRGQTSSYELDVVTPSGQRKSLHVTGTPYFGESGEILGTFGFLRDITDIKRDRKQLESREHRFRTLAASISDAVVVANHAGRIEFWNEAAAQLFGYTESEALGKDFIDLLVPRRWRRKYRVLFRRFRSTGRPEIAQGSELMAIGKDGRRVLVEVSYSSFTSNGWYALGCMRDIKARKETERRLEKTAHQLRLARERAEAANEAKGQFLASMSHEIRTPMNGIIGMTGLLLDSNLDAEQRSFAELVRQSADVLLTLINDILDFSKIEAGRVSLETIPFDLRHAIQDIVELLRPRVEEKGVELLVDYPLGAHHRFMGDPTRIRQIITNLVGNAIKFTSSGHIVVRVVLGEKDPDGACALAIEVEDTGIGIPDDVIPQLFERFSQADSSTTRRFGGTGLGLAIVRGLVTQMGGDVEVESAVGAGSLFRVRLSLAVDGEPQRVLVSAHLRGRRILVVDDLPIGRFLASRLCRTWGMEVEEAASGLEAVEMASSGRFDIVLLDRMMPDYDGEFVLRTLRARVETSSLPVVILTSAGLRGERRHLELLGCNGYVVKPARAEMLEMVLSKVLGSTDAGLQTGTLTVHSVVEEPAASRSFRALLAEDNLINQKLAVRLLENMGGRVDVASNGLEAVRMASDLPYDIIFMDCQMPEMDGYEATSAIRAGGRSSAPVVALTAAVLEQDRVRCQRAGMDDYLSKPLRVEELKRCLSRWIHPQEPTAERQLSLI